MKRLRIGRMAAGISVALAAHASVSAATVVLTAPVDFQIEQRSSKDHGNLTLRGSLSDLALSTAVIEARIVGDPQAAGWRPLQATFTGTTFLAQMPAPAGGWYRLEVRALADGKPVAHTQVEHVGIGEIFVVAGQSNSANHGSERQQVQSGKVASCHDGRWRIAHDPQPGASGGGGSFMPPLGDALAQRFGVPIGFVACGIGATSVREWLPQGARFPHPPTLVSRVRQLPDGGWESTGAAFAMFSARLQALGPHGFRAVLWHQGESDANQQDPTRTLPGPLYREYLEQIIRSSRQVSGCAAPWFVPRVSYHVPGDESSPDIRAAQASLWTDGIAQAGPDSDALTAEWRENGGKGVHFSGPGLREHAGHWAERITPWLVLQLERNPDGKP